MKKIIITAAIISCSCCMVNASFEGGVFTSSGFQPTNSEQKFYVPVKDVQQPYTTVNTNNSNVIVNDDDDFDYEDDDDEEDYYTNNNNDNYNDNVSESTTLSYLSDYDNETYNKVLKLLKDYDCYDHGYSNFINKYPQNEDVMRIILDNYSEMKKEKVLDDDTIAHVLATTDWNSFTGKNFALALAKRMKKTGLYSNNIINDWVGRYINWSQINKEPLPEAIKVIDKGYLDYMKYMDKDTVVSNGKEFLSYYIQTIDLMKSYNVEDYICPYIVSALDWNKPKDVYTIVSYLLSDRNPNSRNNGNILLVAFDSISGKDIYKIYEKVNNTNIADKQTEFLKEYKKYEKEKNKVSLGSKIENVGNKVLNAGVYATAPVWIPLMMFGVIDIDHH